ncbi:gamma-glutamylcyclotransferase [Halobacillus litoralis]|uniref:gamma-glutamylcyclotransferase n=1 Tax=Halobacillus litoralis TaxID=45668 RepID=UPI00136F4299
MYVFVYGSLCSGQQNHSLMDKADLVSRQAFIKGALYAGSSYDPLLREDEHAWTYGELYSINPEFLPVPGDFEDVLPDHGDGGFYRKEAEVFTDKGSVKAEACYWNGSETGKSIPHNDWKVHQYLQQDSYLYFAYGSCMDDARFISQQVHHLFEDVKGKGSLHGFRLAFSYHLEDGSRADIQESENDKVEGVLYNINKEALHYLFLREGVEAAAYRPAIVPVETDDGAVHQAVTFTVLSKKEDAPPPFHYAEELYRGGERYLSPEYIDALKQRFLHDLKVQHFQEFIEKRSRPYD